MAKGGRLVEEASAIQERRERVLTLKVESGLQPQQIAAVLNVSVPTIQRDLAWIRRVWGRRYREQSKFDGGAVIGQALERYDRIADLAMQNYAAGNGIDEMTQRARPMTVHEKMYALRTAAGATALYTRTLFDCGLLHRELGSIEVQQRFDAREIGAIAKQLQQMRSAKGDDDPSEFVVDGELMVSEGERRYLTDGPIDDDGSN